MESISAIWVASCSKWALDFLEIVLEVLFHEVEIEVGSAMSTAHEADYELVEKIGNDG